MNYIFWNIKDLGSGMKRRVIRETMIANQLGIVGLSKTKVNLLILNISKTNKF